MSNHADLLMLSIHRRRFGLAVAGVIVSILLHIGGLFWLSHTPLDMTFADAEAPDARAEHARPMQVRETPPEALPISARATAEPPPLDAARAAFQSALALKSLEVPPDTVDLEPPSAAVGTAAAEPQVMPEPASLPQPEAWQPRQDILVVEQTRVLDALAAVERRVIPALERIPEARDIVYPAEPRPAQLAPPPAAVGTAALEAPGLAAILRQVSDVQPAAIPATAPSDEVAASGTGVLAETPEDVAPAKPIDMLLGADVASFRSRRDPNYTYFRVAIRPRADHPLAVIPKDVLFIQDCSASMAEERLYFCRQGLVQSLAGLGPQDRFNVIAFRETVAACFDGWRTNSATARSEAQGFIESLRSSGETDIFAAVRAALRFQQVPGRPVIVVLVTDGYATTGLTDGAAIIREFTRANNGAVSVFAMGTLKLSHTYLLDLLSFGNRGDARVVTQGRWGIGDALTALTREVSQPVLAEVRLRVAASTPGEIYPVQTMNLYSDRPLVVYGRCPRSQSHVVFRATGRAGDAACDMIFDLDLEDPALASEDDLRQEWARQKIWHLLGEHARTRSQALIAQIEDTARAYRIEIPHRRVLQEQ